MYRFALREMKEWISRSNRKPMVIRGARQVGKSFLVHMLAEESFEQFLEINFERTPELGAIFSSNDPSRIVTALELQFNLMIIPGETLIFLDEIQVTPEVLAALRYFYEDMPELHIIAAGSLLEFVLDEPDFSVPVGRIEYMFLGPMTFEEFLLALGEQRLQSFISTFTVGDDLPGGIHDKLMDLVRVFCITGGMPASIKAYVESSHQGSEQEKQSIVTTYYDDLGKYRGKTDPRRLRKVFDSVPNLVGEKLKYVKIDPTDQARNLSHALDLLASALVVQKVYHSASNGMPLRAEKNDTLFKLLCLDVGLMSTSCGLNILDLEKAEDLSLNNCGAICEQFVGQHLLFSNAAYVKPELYYWLREKRTSNAEVDYVRSFGSDIYPVEVKSGKTGTLKSMQVFLNTKNREFAVRFNGDLPSFHMAHYALPKLGDKAFGFLSLPFYLVGQLDRLVANQLN